MIMFNLLRARLGAIAIAVSILSSGCTREVTLPEPVIVWIDHGESFQAAAIKMESAGVISSALGFRMYAKLKKVDRDIKPGAYQFSGAVSWEGVLEDVRKGNVLKTKIVIPEGWDLQNIRVRLQRELKVSQAEVDQSLSPDLVTEYGVPGPTLEGYLYPATYEFPLGTRPKEAVRKMVAEYKKRWTPERKARAAAIGMTEREVVTLASIVEKEAVHQDEMPRIAAVYRYRLKVRYPLQADPTVLYALGGHRKRLLYAAIDSVASHPYNTYRRPGLPPGPIGSPSEAALDAVLYAPETKELYFVAGPDGRHIFTKSLEEHNRAKRRVRALKAP